MTSRDLILAALWRRVPAWAIETMIVRLDDASRAPGNMLRAAARYRLPKAVAVAAALGTPSIEAIAARVVERSLADLDAGRLPRSIPLEAAA